MFGYLVRRGIAAVTVVFATAVGAFFLFFAGPSDPAVSICGQRNCTADRLQDIRESLGLQQPLLEQFWEFFAGIFAGREIHTGGFVKKCGAPCLGYSFITDQPVTTVILHRIPVTVSVALGGVLIGFVVGVLVGSFAAIRRGSAVDKGLVSGSLVLTSIPYYIVALIAWIYLALVYPVFPRPGYVPISESPLGWFKGLLLAWLVLGFFESTSYARYMRASLVDVLGEDYVRTARAKGLSARRVNFRHGARAALTSVVTILGLNVASLLAGTIFTEKIFSVQGLGVLALDSFNRGDLPVIMGVVIYSAGLLVIFNVLVDVAYSFLDPRVRLG